MRVTINEAAQRLGVSEHTVRRRLAKGELTGVQEAMRTGGFQWWVDMPDAEPLDPPASGELAALRELIASLNDQVQALREQLGTKDQQMAVKDQQIAELHVLLQQAQGALPPPKGGRAWWRWWGRS